MGRDEDDPSGTRAQVVDELPRHVESAVFAEIDVEQRHVGVEVGRASQRLGPRRGDADDTDALVLQQGAGGVEKARVVVDDQAAQYHEIMLGGLRAAVAATRQFGSPLIRLQAARK